MLTVDLEVVYLSQDGPVEHQLSGITLYSVCRTPPAPGDERFDATAAESVAAGDGDDWLGEHAAAHGAQQGRRLLQELGRLWRGRHRCSCKVQRSPVRATPLSRRGVARHFGHTLKIPDKTNFLAVCAPLFSDSCER